MALSAFGAHGLRSRGLPADRLDIWETAARYHLVHALLLVVLARTAPALRWAPRLLLSGTLIFSGSLYALVLLDVRRLGAVTPVGGLLLILGWIALAIESGRRPS